MTFAKMFEYVVERVWFFSMAASNREARANSVTTIEKA